MNRKVIYTTIVAAIAGVLFGFDTAVISGTIPYVTKHFSLEPALVGWFVSSALVGSILGVSFSGLASDKFGRKNMLIISAVGFLLSALGCSISNGFTELIIYRMLGGIAIGLASMVAPLYISEISPKKYRGRLVTVYQLCITMGILLAYFSNSFIQFQEVDFKGIFSGIEGDGLWRTMFFVEVVPAFIFLIGLIFVSKSPQWLMLRGEAEQARELSNSLGIESPTLTDDESNKVSLSELVKGNLKKPMGIAVFLMLFSQLCGINAIIYYGPSILAEAGLSLGDSLGGQVSIGIVNMLFTIFAILFVDRWGRKPLLTLGALGVTFALLTTGMLFQLGVDSGYSIVGTIILFIACYAFSLGPIQFVVASEIFPLKFRAKAMSVCTMMLWVANAIVGQVFPILLDSAGPAITFFIFGGIGIPAVYIILKFIPETKGKSFEEIQKMWNKNHISQKI
ncbi:sugar porter family MFS transporter [Flammeovirga yaeyamensis]|uniref:Sugar porter family MFS transporter n=1 Tax=Flammeovirga yaeyamensis TaxID=367791 RepID=A0AAX1NDP0_9BACT|nr:sugar porter family MFS transporter [Flammeovirga yaeyamensis]MBB3701341.1 sugar porter (SP) family MFS transporter [Flammeovirga yaeyamensis]NMF38591.1 sugar porter family MFS transporter [Flammeovirga yaeyamensis]QWG04445.1 sugar porter family MFS transporter [Flammeovirga yaeyamensis]